MGDELKKLFSDLLGNLSEAEVASRKILILLQRDEMLSQNVDEFTRFIIYRTLEQISEMLVMNQQAEREINELLSQTVYRISIVACKQPPRNDQNIIYLL